MERCNYFLFGIVLIMFSDMALAIEDSYKTCQSFGNKINCEKGNGLQFRAPPEGSVIHSKESFTVVPKSGPSKNYEVNENGECEKCPNHHVNYDQGYRFFWVTGEEYESGYTELISYETGKAYKFVEDYATVDTLKVSPDGKFLLVDHVQEKDPHRTITINLYLRGKLEMIQSFSDRDFSKLKLIDFTKEGTSIWITSNEVGLIQWDGFQPTSIVAKIKTLGNKWELIIEK